MKKNIKFFILCLTFSLSIFSQNLNEKKVLIMWREDREDGHQPELFVEQVKNWLENEDIDYVVSNDLNDYANFEFLSKFNLIIQSVTMSQLTNEQEFGLLKAISGGIGIAGAHGGLADSFRNKTNYQFMIGGQWVEHWKNKNLKSIFRR